MVSLCRHPEISDHTNLVLVEGAIGREAKPGEGIKIHFELCRNGVEGMREEEGGGSIEGRRRDEWLCTRWHDVKVRGRGGTGEIIFAIHPRLNRRDKWVTLLVRFLHRLLGNQSEGLH